MGTGCRISQHLRNYDLGFCSRVPLCHLLVCGKFVSFSVKPCDSIVQKNRFLGIGISGNVYGLQADTLQAKSSSEAPILSDCFSQREDDRELPSDGGIVALGKFDALHVGHRELAVQASKAGIPFLMSFVGMAEVFGWEPRAPIVAKCDRKRVLASWASHCGNVAPTEFHVDFSSVRHLSPRQFVEKLSKEFGVRGVVAGENYRFGYKAAGDTSELVKLCEEYGLGAYIVSSVMDRNQCIRDKGPNNSKERGQVSSTRVRHALAEGDMRYVSELLGRKHRLMLNMRNQEVLVGHENRISAPKSSLLNLSPKDGLYDNCSLLFNEKTVVPCRAIIDTTHIYVEADELGSRTQVQLQNCRVLGIEFDDTEKE
ncbi:FAD synthetase 1, chloroplastic-like isoform X2 [Telopea speciosissima]|uniref:FAD synthetase 1, chloroplastic-like isoform X2 n=1 Tax=Telopea speciosissima TaxID=54955 RepID=UPI001CC4BAA8|nr:FAD synthetase 1, chloroplastic-like isoform X2 [Telopea speciosissima]